MHSCAKLLVLERAQSDPVTDRRMAVVPHLAAARAIGEGDLDRVSMDVQTHVDSDTLVHGLPPRKCVVARGINGVVRCARAHNPRYRGGKPTGIKPFCLD